MLAGPFAVASNRQRNCPMWRPRRPRLRGGTGRSAAAARSSTATADAYPAASPPGTAAVQTVSPVFLLRATMVAFSPPGVQMTLSPSISGSRQGPLAGLPPKSSRRLFCQRTFPSRSRQASSPSELRRRAFRVNVGVTALPDNSALASDCRLCRPRRPDLLPVGSRIGPHELVLHALIRRACKSDRRRRPASSTPPRRP